MLALFNMIQVDRFIVTQGGGFHLTDCGSFNVTLQGGSFIVTECGSFL